MYLKRFKLIVLLPITIMVLSGCGFTEGVKDNIEEVYPDRKKIDYKRADTINSLEVPPDLTSSTLDSDMVVPDLDPDPVASYSDYSLERSGRVSQLRSETVLPDTGDIRVEREGKTRWLVIPETPKQVWPKMREFWLQMGFLIKKEDPRIGILETDWTENRADIKSDFITSILAKALDKLYSAATRDKFRVRLDRGSDEGTSELYLTHYGAEEVVQGSSEAIIWKPRPNDPELEIEMLRRLAVSLGVEEEKSRNMFASKARQRQDRARLTRSSTGTSLKLDDQFPRAWRRTGVALDRVGFTVEDRDRTKGLYYVRYYDPLAGGSKVDEGWLDKFKIWSWGDSEQKTVKYQIYLASSDSNTTDITVRNESGQLENSNTADRILTLLHEELK
jgi:outer membrane protein assembly factor BamC